MYDLFILYGTNECGRKKENKEKQMVEYKRFMIKVAKIEFKK